MVAGCWLPVTGKLKNKVQGSFYFEPCFLGCNMVATPLMESENYLYL
jgi:hypothetical protein